MMRVARAVSVVTSVALAGAALSAQEGRRQGGGPGGATRLIVRAVANGQPVADLKAEELTIRVDGRQREVKSLELVSAATAPATAGGATPEPASTLPSPFDTNVSAVEGEGADAGPRTGVPLTANGR